MESENGVTLEDETCVVEANHVEESVTELNKEGQNADLGDKAPTMNGKSEPATVNDDQNSSGEAVKAHVTAPLSKSSKTTKVNFFLAYSNYRSTLSLSCYYL